MNAQVGGKAIDQLTRKHLETTIDTNGNQEIYINTRVERA